MPSVDQLLADARSGLDRLEPAEAQAACESGAVLIDIRAESQRAADGEVPGARFVPRNVLEWRLDPPPRTAIRSWRSPRPALC